MKDGNGRWVGCGFYFLKALIVDGGGARGLYIYIYIDFIHVCNFLGLLLLRKARKVRCGVCL